MLECLQRYANTFLQLQLSFSSAAANAVDHASLANPGPVYYAAAIDERRPSMITYRLALDASSTAPPVPIGRP
ncbi:hypothetical protein CERZMDRAFT_89533 [Cercospora zeae-maydis SCOH1-5]|uniref:Uncharacterized protein n=1 Tax=Cercospora zeae-maydis SCOH1-5 TaxID=717836 RepID=A0A6A6FVF8_9PEZI|nr:hypothetical protein CERZMDRAFT_89533 [Cercospora zeae-maydis SCOH1-5]